MLAEAPGADTVTGIERRGTQKADAVAGDEQVDVWPAASALLATSSPSAARVGFSGPVAMWTSSLGIDGTSSRPAGLLEAGQRLRYRDHD